MVNNSKHTFLVIGINGMIGSALFTYFNAKGEAVWGTTYKPTGNEEKNVFYLNLADEPASWQIPSIPFTTVYLCAGVCRKSLCDSYPEITRRINVDGMIALARYFSDRKAFVIFLSTNQVFSGRHVCVPENASYQPTSEYGHQKATVETLMKANCKNYAIVRLTKVIGPTTPLLQMWIGKLMANQSIEVFHDMMLAPVALQWVIKTLVRIGITKQTACFQLSGLEDISYYHFANELAILLNRSSELVRPVSAFDRGIKENSLPQHTSLDYARVVSMGWGKPRPYSQILRELVDNL